MESFFFEGWKRQPKSNQLNNLLNNIFQVGSFGRVLCLGYEGLPQQHEGHALLKQFRT